MVLLWRETSRAYPSARQTLGSSRLVPRLLPGRSVAEAHIGELFGVISPTMCSAQRHRQGAPHRKRKVGMAENEVSLLLAAIAYELVHVVRCALEQVTDAGWSLRRVRERVLKAAGTVVRHARQVVYRITTAKAALWSLLAGALPDIRTAAEVTT